MIFQDGRRKNVRTQRFECSKNENLEKPGPGLAKEVTGSKWLLYLRQEWLRRPRTSRQLDDAEISELYGWGLIFTI